MIENPEYSATTQLLALHKFGGITPRLFEVLFRHFGSLSEIMNAPYEDVEAVPGMTAEVAEQVFSARDYLDDAEVLARGFAERDITICGRHGPDYPGLLSELNDPPLLLFVRGHLPGANERTIALVGADQATNDGIELTTRLARKFADKKIQIVSSLFGGIDYASHLGCRAAGGESFAVLEYGFDCLEGVEAVPLAIDIARNGGIVSEYFPSQMPSDQTMSEANRLLAGLAQAVVVPECYSTSERTLDLLSFCNEIGKLTFLMVDPDHRPLFDESSLKHALENGAVLMEGLDKVDDIIKVLV